MALTADAYDDLVTRIYNAAAGRVDWREPMDRVARECGLWAAQLFAVDPRDGRLLYSYEGGGAPPEAALEYLRTWHQRNPRLPLLASAPIGAWTHDHEALDPEVVANDPFFEAFLRPLGGGLASATKLVEDHALLVVFAAIRPAGAPPPDVAQRAVLERLRGHLVQAVEQHVGWTALRSENGLARRLLERLPQPLMLVDDTRRIRVANAAARETLAHGDLVEERGGFLIAPQPATERALLLGLRRLQLQNHFEVATAPAERVVIPLRPLSGRGGALVLSALRPSATMAAFGSEPLALAAVIDPRRSGRLDPYTLSLVYDLTPAESRVAASLGKGESVKAIAHRHGVSPTTIQTQLRSLRFKTSTRRQAELVALLSSFRTSD